VEKKRAILARQDDLRQRIAQERCVRRRRRRRRRRRPRRRAPSPAPHPDSPPTPVTPIRSALRAAEQPAIDQVTAQRKALKEELDKLMAKNEATRAAASADRDACAALREARRDLVAQTEAVKAEVEARRAQIVGSPWRLKNELAALETAVDSEQRAADDLDTHKRLIMRQVEIVAKADKDVVKALALMAEAEVEVKKVKNIMKDEKQRKAEAEAVGGDVDALRAQVEHAAAQRKRAEDRLAEVRESYAQKIAALNRAIDATRRESAELTDDVKAAADTRRAAEAHKLQLERQQEAATSAHSADVADMVATLKHFTATIGAYNAGLVQSLAAIEATPLRVDGGL
jgi:chromosome segregation ATPase